MLQVQAHGGGLLKVKDTWYWYGESYKRPLLDDFLSEGVNLYSSSGEDQPCTCLRPHMPPRSCGGPTLHHSGWQLVSTGHPPSHLIYAEPNRDIAVLLSPACSSL